jgi:hypothetical protein
MAVIDVSVQTVVTALVPLRETVLDPLFAPKFRPVMTTADPTGPEFGEMLDMEFTCASA